MPADSPEAAILLSQLEPSQYYTTHDYERAELTFARTRELARRLGDASLEARVLWSSALIDALELRMEHYVEKIQSALEHLHHVSDSSDRFRFLIWGVAAALDRGDRTLATEHLGKVRDLAHRDPVPDPYLEINALGVRHRIVTLEGNFPESRKLSDQLLSLHSGGNTLAGRALLEAQTGDIDSARRYMNQALNSREFDPENRRSAFSYMGTGQTIATYCRIVDHPEALELAEELAAFVVSKGRFPLEIVNGMLGLAMVAVVRGDRRHCAHRYGELESIPHMIDHRSFSSMRVLGLLAAGAGNLDRAAEHFTAGAEFCRSAGFLPELAWICYDYADALLQRGTAEDSLQAQALIEEGLAIARKTGMPPLEGNFRALIAGIKGETLPDGLTKREAEVLRLIARGGTNKEIADELFIVAKTVAGHIGNIYAKTGVSNRAEATAYAIRNGLAEETPSAP